jgi:hypothetical protein
LQHVHRVHCTNLAPIQRIAERDSRIDKLFEFARSMVKVAFERTEFIEPKFSKHCRKEGGTLLGTSFWVAEAFFIAHGPTCEHTGSTFK